MKKILIIEDNTEVRENIAEILELADYEALAAENGKIGLDLAIKEKPDLIICDIMMPVMDGYEVLHLLGKKAETAHIPFIFLTAKAERNDMRKGMEMGASDYITKPFERMELLNAIEIRLRQSELVKKDFSPSVEGLNHFMSEAGVKNSMESLILDRKTYHFKKKQVVYSEGNYAEKLYFVQKGKIKTFKATEDGKELISGFYQAGDFLGYVSLLEDEPYKETAEAMEECEIVFIPKQEFETLLNQNRPVMQKFVRMLANNVSEREGQLLTIAYNSLRKRIAKALINLYRKSNHASNTFSNITREDLAKYVGTATESLIRTISDFKEEGLIDVREGKIYIVNETKLDNMRN
jgi:CRP-like cAMP-binding protein/ActR/RegA family two-component response regulator